jgi:hypothetical protein
MAVGGKQKRSRGPEFTGQTCTCGGKGIGHPLDLKEESCIMTSDTPSPGAPTPQAPSPTKPARRWPDPGTPRGAVLYAVIAGLIVWIIIGILSHIHILITWH